MSGYKSGATSITRELVKEPLVGVLGAGEYKVGIESIVKLGNHYRLTCINSNGERHVGRLFIFNRNGDDLSVQMKGMLAATVESPEELIELSTGVEAGTIDLATSHTGRSLRVLLTRRDRFLNITQFGRTDEPISIPKKGGFTINSFLFPTT